MDSPEHELLGPLLTGTDWRAAIFSRWLVLGLRVLRVDANDPLALEEVGHESRTLAAVVAWFEQQGNITLAADRLRTSRRALRRCLLAWTHRNPRFVPPERAKRARPKKSRRRKRKDQPAGSQAGGDSL